MKLLKASFLIVLLGLPLMGSNCGGTVIKCDGLDKANCEIADNPKQCKWESNIVPGVDAKCEGPTTRTPSCESLVVVTPKPSSQQTGADSQACKDKGCVYQLRTDTVDASCSGQPTEPATCHAFNNSKSECGAWGCTYTDAVSASDTSKCVDNK